MTIKIIQALFFLEVCAFGFDDFVMGEPNQEMIEHGRIQYQLLKEKSSLPQYGSCWKSAVEHLDEGCRHLSEETQSDIALHITNCFLEMSGHETYSCEEDKKPNLRAICINSMSDRAFNVYTEFFTHTQNICWFLRGQIWQETIAENTVRVGKQLEATANNQESLLKAQRESLELQEKMIEHGRILEHTLDHLYVASKTHKDVLMMLSNSIENLQTWIIGEVSWIDSVIFYVTAIIIISLFTSSQATSSARLPIFFLLFLNLILERFICSLAFSQTPKFNLRTLYSDVYSFIWYLRYALMFLSVFILFYKTFTYKNLQNENNKLLCKIREDNEKILTVLDSLKCWLNPCKTEVDVVTESTSRSCLQIEQISSSFCKENSLGSKNGSFSNFDGNKNVCDDTYDYDSKTSLVKNGFQTTRYNLRSSRSRQNTPECY